MKASPKALPQPLYKMATRAWHKLLGWKMSMPSPDLCYVKEEDRRNYYGMWVCGIGAFDVKFPKRTTRDLTDAEAEGHAKCTFRLNDMRWAYRKGELLNKTRNGVVLKGRG